MSWRIAVRHRTGHRYAQPVQASYNEARLTPPTRDGSVTFAIRANVAPLPEPSAAAKARKAMVPTWASSGVVAATAAPTTTTAYPVTSTGIGPRRSESQPPTGRMITASGVDTPIANMHLTILDKLGIPTEKLGNSTADLKLDRLST